jgi:hypothetical protein
MAVDERARQDFGEFVAARSAELLRLACVLTGDRHAGEDLLQSAHIDYRRLLEDTGFAVEIYEEPPGWRCQQRELAEAIIAAEEEVTHEMGTHYPALTRVFIAVLPTARCMFVAARRLPF